MMVECQVVAGLTWGTLALAMIGGIWLIVFWTRVARLILRELRKPRQLTAPNKQETQ